jgi:hypothetical protein
MMKNRNKFKYIRYVDIEHNEIKRTILDRPASEFEDCILIAAVHFNLKPNRANEFRSIRNYIIFASLNN